MSPRTLLPWRPLAGTLLCAGLCAGQSAPPVAPPPPGTQDFSRWAYPSPTDPDGRLAYKVTSRGDRLPDFSHAGYGGGGVPLPRAQVMIDLSPLPGGDDTARIQAAIDYVEGLPLDPQGLRGAVLLRRGEYRLQGHLTIEQSGVVLRGEGRGRRGTILRAVGDDRRTLIQVQGQGQPQKVAGSRQAIVDARVSVGARSFTVADASGFAPGQRVIVERPTTQEWIDVIGMDARDNRGGTRYDTSDIYVPGFPDGPNPSTCLTNPWQPNGGLRWDRVVTAVQGNVVTVDAPLTTAIEQDLGGGFLYAFTFPGRITQVGVERLRGVSDYDGAEDEDHSWVFVGLEAVEDAWVDRVIAQHFAYATALVGPWSRRVTVQDSKCLDPKSKITGGRRYSFKIDDAQLVLMQRLYSRKGRHDFVLGSMTPGPNVFLECEAEDSYSDTGPHLKWSSGALFDNVATDDDINLRNRGNAGTNHGWAGANCVLWNARAKHMIVQDPPGAKNWVIGGRTGGRRGDGTWDAVGTTVWPQSLYLRQLEERLGPGAVAAIAK